MSTPERCRARAEEAERLASIVAYGRDRTRLLSEAAELRARADALEAAAQVAEPPRPDGSIRRWLRRLRRRS